MITSRENYYRGTGGAPVSEGREIERLLKMLADVQDFYRLEKIRGSLTELDKRLATFDLFSRASTIAGLMLLPEFQANTVRLETLSHLFCLRAAGDQRITSENLSTWLKRGSRKIAPLPVGRSQRGCLRIKCDYAKIDCDMQPRRSAFARIWTFSRSGG